MANPPRRKFSTSDSFPAFASSLTNKATVTIFLFLHACESAASRGGDRELLMRWREEQLQLGRPRNLDSAPARVAGNHYRNGHGRGTTQATLRWRPLPSPPPAAPRSTRAPDPGRRDTLPTSLPALAGQGGPCF